MHYPTNRDRKLASRRGRSWCDYCDRTLVAIGGRCPLCHRKEMKRRLKRNFVEKQR